MLVVGSLTVAQVAAPFFILLVIAVIITVLVFAWLAEKKRREALAALAARLGLHFNPGRHRGLESRYGAASICSRGHSRKASNSISGEFGEGAVCYFDYQYTVGSGKNQTTYHASVCAFHSPFYLERLLVRPENILDKAAAFVGFDDIDLDLAEFNKRFYVKCADKKFAYDVLSQRVMEFFLDRRRISMEIIMDCAVFHYAVKLKPPDIEALLRDSAEFFGRLPDYLKEDRLKGTAVAVQSKRSGPRVREADGGFVPDARRGRRREGAED